MHLVTAILQFLPIPRIPGSAATVAVAISGFGERWVRH